MIQSIPLVGFDQGEFFPYPLALAALVLSTKKASVRLFSANGQTVQSFDPDRNDDKHKHIK